MSNVKVARPVTGKLILVFGAISCRKSAGEKLTKSGSMSKLLSIKIAICTINPVLNATKTCLIHNDVTMTKTAKSPPQKLANKIEISACNNGLA